MDNRQCPNCGMEREDWPDDGAGGYLKDGEKYCCRGCGDGTGCTCVAAPAETEYRSPTKEEIRDDPASGEFVQSLQKETKHIKPEDYGDERIEKRSTAGSGPD